MKWTDKRVSKLKKLWEQGYSGSEIAEILGCVSRAAVLGKLHRLGMKRKKK